MTAEGPSPGHWMRVLAADEVPSDLAPPLAPLPGEHWRPLLREATRRRLVGALAWAISDGRWPADDEQHDAVLDAHESLVARDLILERQLVEQVELLGTHDIGAVVLKGPALATLAYPRASARSYRDIDLLVPPGTLHRAASALEAAGARRHYPEPRPGYDDRFSKGVALTTPAGMEIDLHRTLAAGVHGLLVDPADIIDRSADHPVGGAPIRMPDLTTLAVHACLHAVLGEAWPPPEILRDVAVTFHHPRVEVDDVVDRATAWQADTVVAFAIGAAWTDLALDRSHPAARWAADHRPTAPALRRLDPYIVDRRDHVRQALAATWALRWGDRPAYLRAVVLPGQAVRSHPNRWARGLWRSRRQEGSR